MSYILLFNGNNGYATVAQCYVYTYIVLVWLEVIVLTFSVRQGSVNYVQLGREISNGAVIIQ